MSDTIDLTGDETVPTEPVVIDDSDDDVPAPIQIRRCRPSYRRRPFDQRAARMSVPSTRGTHASTSIEAEATDSTAESKQGFLALDAIITCCTDCTACYTAKKMLLWYFSSQLKACLLSCRRCRARSITDCSSS